MYKAKIDIGDYKKGEEVPAEKAIVWMKMYKGSPVYLVGKAGDSVQEVPKEDKPKEENSSDEMLDDYLNRNKHVVKKSISEDDLSKDVLHKLVSIEEGDKKRKDVLKALKNKLRGS